MRSQLMEALEEAIACKGVDGERAGRWQEVLDAAGRIEPGDVVNSEFEAARIAEALRKPSGPLRAVAADLGDGLELTPDQVLGLCRGLFEGLAKHLSARTPEEIPDAEHEAAAAFRR